MKILKGDSPALHTVALEVPHGEDKSALIGEMQRLMCEYRGIGLAAPQVGRLCRVIVFQTPERLQTLINPKIVKRGGGQARTQEGCLSFPGKQVRMLRHRRVKVEGWDRAWRPVILVLRGTEAVCVQHEIDHLNGVTIADKLSYREHYV